MKKVAMIFPTHRRPFSAERLLRSVRLDDYPNIEVTAVVNDETTAKDLLGVRRGNYPLHIFRGEESESLTSMVNQGVAGLAPYDALLLLSDDMLLAPWCVSIATEALFSAFPDGDGIVALCRLHNRLTTGSVLAGKAFVDRFPKGQLYCPDYIHYAVDTEQGLFARHAKICLETAAFVLHLHDEDGTYAAGLDDLRRDTEMFDRRQAAGYLWGMNFNLFGKGAA